MEGGRFTREFRLEAVELVTDRGVTIAQASWDPDVNGTELRRWVAIASLISGTADPPTPDVSEDVRQRSLDRRTYSSLTETARQKLGQR